MLLPQREDSFCFFAVFTRRSRAPVDGGGRGFMGKLLSKSNLAGDRGPRRGIPFLDFLHKADALDETGECRRT